MRQPQWFSLLNKSEIDIPRVGTQRVPYLLTGFRRDNNPNLLNTVVGQMLYDVVKHRFIGDRHQLLGHRVGQGAQSCSSAAGEH